MSYGKLPFKRENPGCVLFVLDQSGSMSEPFGRVPSVSKAQGVADAVNRLLQTLCLRCTKSDGVRHYFDVGVLVYGVGDDVASAFPRSWARHDLVPIPLINDHPLRFEKRSSPAIGDMPARDTLLPVWIEPRAELFTPMCAALRKAENVVGGWIKQHKDSFPPIVLHVTDGESTDGDPIGPARRITDMGTSDGNVLLFNCHISHSSSAPIVFVADPPVVEDELAPMLFEMSSVLPAGFVAEARASGHDVHDGARGFAFNADLVELIQFLDIGTRATRQLR